MTTATDILTELKELWEGAEPAPYGADDAIIIQYATGEYSVRRRAGYDSEGVKLDHVRILERAKPKAPEWEAVVASYTEDEEHRRQVFTRNDWGKWESTHWYTEADELVDPVPLVELPEREALARAIAGSIDEEPGNFHLIPADAVLELLRGERGA